MRLVLDTNVVISGLLWDGPPARLMRVKSATLFTSGPLLSELTSTLSRRKFDWRVAATGLAVHEMVARYAALTTQVRPAQVPRLAPDPDDDVVIGTAIAARADFIVTGDQALLSVRRYDGGRIISVIEALDAISPA